MREPVTSSNRSFDLLQVASEGIFSPTEKGQVISGSPTNQDFRVYPTFVAFYQLSLSRKYRVMFSVFSQDLDWTRAWLGME